jgi:acyl dehydratase
VIGMRTFDSLARLGAAVGEHLGHSEWLPVEQARVDAFAEATGDHQWIHVDPVRAAAGPYGGTIAHGYLVLSLLPVLAAQVYRVDGVRLAVNYGLNRVRFPAPVPTGSAVRAGIRLLAADEVPGGLHVVNEVTVERQGQAKPCCVAETVSRLYA